MLFAIYSRQGKNLHIRPYIQSGHLHLRLTTKALVACRDSAVQLHFGLPLLGTAVFSFLETVAGLDQIPKSFDSLGHPTLHQSAIWHHVGLSVQTSSPSCSSGKQATG